MDIKLHPSARTTPAIRRELQASTEKTAVLPRRYGLSRVTVRNWRKRKDVLDRSHRPHKPKNGDGAQVFTHEEARRTLILRLLGYV